MLQGFSPITLSVFAALGIMSVAALTVIVFKTVQFRRLGVGRQREGEAVLDDWLNGRPDEAVRKAGSGRGVVVRVLLAVIQGLRARPNDPAYGEELGRQAALVEMAAMNGRMRLLEAVVQGAPMIGLLGTVIGMIDAFAALSSTGQTADPQLLAAGIWTALTTTAAGLAIALCTFFMANWLESRIDSERNRIEMAISAAIHGRVTSSAR